MIRIVLLLACFAVPSVAWAQPTVTPGSGFEVDRYVVALRPDLTTTAVSGTETVVLRGTSEGLKQLAFTANALRISDATLDAKPVQVSSGKDAIVFTLPRILLRVFSGTGTIV